MLTARREIVDESDVYIDVHKAIRRLAPAPTATFRRRESMKADSEDAGRQTDQESRRSYSVGGQGDVSSGSPKIATFKMKRRSTGPGVETSTTVPVKHNVDQVKKHLSRHLSPSNPAANPKNIKSSTVTIKPGAGSTPTPSSRQAELTHEPEELDAENERAPLLGHKPAATTSDATLHATPNYGSSTLADSGNSGEMADLKTGRSVQIQPTENSVSRAAKNDLEEARRPVNPRDDKTESTEGPDMPTSFRTGSITESYVQMGGVRKVIISSGDEDDNNGTEPPGSANAKSEPAQGSQTGGQFDAAAAAQGSEPAEQAPEAETHGHAAGEEQPAQGSSSQQGGGQGKKKKKAKKNKGKK